MKKLWYHIKKGIAAVLMGLLLLSGCNADEQYGSPYACSFVFYTSYHPTSVLSLSMSNPGLFVIVTPQTEQGVTHLLMTTNAGNTENLALVTEKESGRMSYQNMGANRRLIVGCSNFNGLKAYDGHCSNCLRNLGGTNYPLTWADNGRKLECGRCGRRYDPNTEGTPTDNAQKGDRPLYQYAIRHDGQLLHVYNGQIKGW